MHTGITGLLNIKFEYTYKAQKLFKNLIQLCYQYPHNERKWDDNFL